MSKIDTGNNFRATEERQLNFLDKKTTLQVLFQLTFQTFQLGYRFYVFFFISWILIQEASHKADPYPKRGYKQLIFSFKDKFFFFKFVFFIL